MPGQVRMLTETIFKNPPPHSLEGNVDHVGDVADQAGHDDDPGDLLHRPLPVHPVLDAMDGGLLVGGREKERERGRDGRGAERWRIE